MQKNKDCPFCPFLYAIMVVSKKHNIKSVAVKLLRFFHAKKGRLSHVALNEKQKAFAEHYAACLNATEAAKRAGYSAKTAYSSGQRLLKNVEIKNYIQSLTESAKNKRIATIE